MKKTLLTIAATAVMATSALAESNMGWKTNTDIDEMEGTKTHFHFARSYDIKGSFVIRYPDNYQDVRDVDIFYSSGDNYICTSLDGKLEVKMKIDDGPVKIHEARIDTSNSALFFRTTEWAVDPKWPQGVMTWDQAWKKKKGLSYLSDEYKALDKAMKKAESLRKEFGHTGDILVENSLKQDLLTAKQVMVRYHDNCGNQVTQKFILN